MSAESLVPKINCLHERVRFPARPVPDAWYPCPDCGERVGRRGGRIITARESNALLDARRAHLDALARGEVTDEMVERTALAMAANAFDEPPWKEWPFPLEDAVDRWRHAARVALTAALSTGEANHAE
jgi:hypothetical protein